MQSRWSDNEASEFVARYGPYYGEDLALCTYASRLLGAEDQLVLHGGGNCSVKSTHKDVLGRTVPALYVKGSGFEMATIEPEGHAGLYLEYLKQLRALSDLCDEAMADEFRTHLLNPRSPAPSIEALTHAFLPPKFVDHTHADAILTLTNQAERDKHLRDALGEDVIVLEYVRPGFRLAKASAEAFDSNPGKRAIVWVCHGLATWGSDARQAYEVMIELVTRAEQYAARHATRRVFGTAGVSAAEAQKRLIQVAPLLRGALAEPTGDADRPFRRVILQPLVSREVLDFIAWEGAKELALAPPLASDHLIRTKAWPLWIDHPAYDDCDRLRSQITASVSAYKADYSAYVERHTHRMPSGMAPFDPLPRLILMPGLGAVCAGQDARAARIARDITAHTLAVKAQVAAMGTYVSMSEDHLFEMEYHCLQHAKLRPGELPLGRQVALVTGAAGSIGSAICEELLISGCHVAVSDVQQDALLALVEELGPKFPNRVLGVPLDVTDPCSVSRGFESVIANWGGVDLVIINAGAALVSSLEEMDLEKFRKLERVNTEGTLLLLREAALHFRLQGTGGDIVVISTKNVFAPGAKFGAYSASKAAAHQLARIASLEMAELGVRVNMVSPDAVFAHGQRKSGLWAEVGPDRMRARGLDEKGLEEYYRQRNLLKAAVTAKHVANAVLFFATRQTPTTGATLPVDGGLPDATPR
jgi:rhamnose utilization protein RhaD (predicted bifunctional aldolase and dehydrogenase)/NAD(P)-dependent dehydrogenase (short-subunit alcohol dehydrogenase family)